MNSPQNRNIFAAIEGGGTSWVAALSKDSPDNILDRIEILTTTPEETLSQIRKWLNERQFDSLGIASFGPIDCQIESPTFGWITTTPKPNWENTNVLKLLGLYDEFKSVPFLFDTDVNAPALAEFSSFKSGEIESCAYITVGTGVGVGLIINGKTVHGLLHPEAGHIKVARKVSSLSVDREI